MKNKNINITKNYLNKIIFCAASFISVAFIVIGNAIAEENSFLFKNVTLYSMDGSNVKSENTDLLIMDGVVKDIGKDLSAPSDVKLIDGRYVITPGFMHADTKIGIVEIDLQAEDEDASVSDDFPLSVALKAEDAFNPYSSLIAINRNQGLTKALTLPNANNGIFAGTGMVVSLGEVGSIMGAKPILIRFDQIGANYAGGSRMATIAILRIVFDAIKNGNLTGLDDFGHGLKKADLLALKKAYDQGQPFIFIANSRATISKIIDLKKEYKFSTIILGADQAFMLAKELGENNIGVIIDPTQNLPNSFESIYANRKSAKILADNGVNFAFAGPNFQNTHNAYTIRFAAGLAVSYGLSHDDALRAMTVNPAKMFSINDKFGTIKKGMKADIVVWDGDPLEFSTQAKYIFVQGEYVNEDDRQTLLAKRYMNKDRDDFDYVKP